jgi:hypothetical protein
MTVCWTDEEMNFIRDNYPQKGCSYVSQKLGYTWITVQRQAHRMGVYKDRGLINMVGQKYGRWTVIERGKKNSGGNSYWLCRCECGSENEVQRQSLIHGTSKQCHLCAVNDNRDMEFYGKIPSSYIKMLQKRSFRKGVPYNLDAEYLNKLLESQDMKCAISGISLIIKKESCGKSTASLDRIIPELGYTKGNVQWVHKDINYMKGTLTEERFIELCKIVTEYRPLELEEACKLSSFLV